MKKQTEEGVLNVVHENKIEDLLNNLQLLIPIKEGEVKCKFCGDIITLNSINGIFPESDTIKISCNKPKCVIALSKYINEKDV